MQTWVYKPDGTKQCGLGTEKSLQSMQADLETVIGKKNVLAAEKRTLPLMISSLCSTPTGRVNAYKITEEGADLLLHGFIGSAGFQLWTFASPSHSLPLAGGDEPFPMKQILKKSSEEEAYKTLAGIAEALTSVGTNPTLIVDLIGRNLRYYQTGASLTFDYRPERVNIEVTDKHEIVKIWFG